MGKLDPRVSASSQIVTFHESALIPAAIPTYTTVAWYVFGLPRQFLSFNQTDAGAAASVLVEWAIRDISAGVQDWQPLQTVVTVPGGATPVNTLLTTGACWLRFTFTGVAGQTCELYCSAFV